MILPVLLLENSRTIVALFSRYLNLCIPVVPVYIPLYFFIDNFQYLIFIWLQRGLMALVDVEGVPVHFTRLTLAHLIASPESIQEIITRHYMRQLLHEMYKVSYV